jgi:hypothetical protein
VGETADEMNLNEVCEVAVSTPLYENTNRTDQKNADLFSTSESCFVADSPNSLIPEECDCNAV